MLRQDYARFDYKLDFSPSLSVSTRIASGISLSSELAFGTQSRSVRALWACSRALVPQRIPACGLSSLASWCVNSSTEVESTSPCLCDSCVTNWEISLKVYHNVSNVCRGSTGSIFILTNSPFSAKYKPFSFHNSLSSPWRAFPTSLPKIWLISVIWTLLQILCPFPTWRPARRCSVALASSGTWTLRWLTGPLPRPYINGGNTRAVFGLDGNLARSRMKLSTRRLEE